MVWPTVLDKEEDFQVPGRCVPAKQLESAIAKTMVDHLRLLNIGSRPCVVRLSGIICVIGLACRNIETIEEMIENGMNVACLNFGHGSLDYHAEMLQDIRTASSNYNKRIRMTCPLGIALVTKGPIIRTGFPFGGHTVELNVLEDDIVKLCGDLDYIMKEQALDIVHLNYKNLHNVIQIGNTLSLTNESVILLCINIEPPVIITRVVKGGTISSRQRVHFPGVPIDIPVLSERDLAVLQFAIANDVDMIFAAYIRSGAAVREIRDVLGPEGKDILIISQIENQQGIDNIDDIIAASDGIIVSRGDLCNEISQEKLFLAQKSIIAKCNTVGKPVICTTHMLESMTKKSRPTRAECCDVANAILDGADSILLFHETSRGDFPVESIRKAAAICKQSEAAVWQKQLIVDLSGKITSPVIAIHAVAIAAVQVSLQLLASAIIIVSSSIKSAQLITKYRPKCPVIAVTRNAKRARQAHLFRGILPLQYKDQRASDWTKDLELRVYHGINFGRKNGFIKPGDPVVIMTSLTHGSGFANRMRILYVTKHVSHGMDCVC